MQILFSSILFKHVCQNVRKQTVANVEYKFISHILWVETRGRLHCYCILIWNFLVHVCVALEVLQIGTPPSSRRSECKTFLTNCSNYLLSILYQNWIFWDILEVMTFVKCSIKMSWWSIDCQQIVLIQPAHLMIRMSCEGILGVTEIRGSHF